jgi:hypothetical protein
MLPRDHFVSRIFYSRSSRLRELRSDLGLRILMNPIGNGNCQFSAVSFQLQTLGIFRSEETLRRDVVQYLRQNDMLGISNDQLDWWNSLTEPRDGYLRRMSREFEFGDQIYTMITEYITIIMLNKVTQEIYTMITDYITLIMLNKVTQEIYTKITVYITMIMLNKVSSKYTQ